MCLYILKMLNYETSRKKDTRDIFNYLIHELCLTKEIIIHCTCIYMFNILYSKRRQILPCRVLNLSCFLSILK